MLTVLALIVLFLPVPSLSEHCSKGFLRCNAIWNQRDNTCISNEKWCDSNCDCANCEDENFCDPSERDRCSFRGMFRCDNGACIPEEGECDGYASCPVDASDEDGCECKSVRGISGTIAYTAAVRNRRRNSRKCWDIEVPPNKYLKLIFQRINMQQRMSCMEDRLLVSEKGNWRDSMFSICSRNSTGSIQVETFNDTTIYYPTAEVYIEEHLIFDYHIAHVLCKRSDAFRCDAHTCIEPEKKCDGNQDCLNGLDELSCEKGVFKVEGVNTSRQLGLQWLKNQRSETWDWKQNTPRAVIAMHLAEGTHFEDMEEDLAVKHLELHISTAILKNDTDVVTPAQLSMFINALLVVCHDPKNFYGYDLVSELKKQVQISKQFHPIPYLALCNAGVTLSQDDAEKLLNVFEHSSQHGFNIEMEALTTMALSCMVPKNHFSNLKENSTATKRFKEMQKDDGSFGNVYTTALVLQALLASGEDEAKDWNLAAAVEFLKEKQNKEDGSFGDFFATYLILPILNGKSLLDIGKISCTENLKMTMRKNSASQINLNSRAKISVNYYLYIGDNKKEQHPIFLKVPENITILEMMKFAADADHKYSFKQEKVMNKTYIYEIFGMVNDPENEKFWLLHTGKNKDAIEIEKGSADEVIVYDQEHIVMWYKSPSNL